MSSSDINNDWLLFCSKIKIILLIKKDNLDVVVINRNMLQHILFMQLCKNDNNDVILIDLANMIEFRSVISSVVQLVKLTK